MPRHTPVKVVRTNKTLSSAVRQRHPWIFRDALPKNVLLPQATPVTVLDGKGNYLGDGLFEEEGDIAIRIWNYASRPVDQAEIERAVTAAIGRRRSLRDLIDSNAVRLVHGDSDGVPGLVVENYAGHLAVQFHSEATRAAVQPLLAELFPKGKYRSITVKETSSRGGETEMIYGLTPVEVEITEGACKYLVNIREGQKTGFYLDLRQARLLLKHFVTPTTSFLNLFGYTGAFTVQALKAGAAKTITVDQAQQALEVLGRQAQLNGFGSENSHGLTIRADDVRNVLTDFQRRKQKFNLVICDPPSFIHNKKQKTKGWDAYLNVYAQTLKVVEPGGVVGFGNCSAQISSSEFELLLAQAAADADVTLYRVLDVGQPPDHPVKMGLSEGRYLKFQYFFVE